MKVITFKVRYFESGVTACEGKKVDILQCVII